MWRHYTGEVGKFIIYWCVIPWGYRWLKSYKRMVFDVTLTSQTSWKLKSTFVQLQNLFFKFKFPSFWHTSSKYGVKHRICGQLRVEQKSKIWCKNIHAFLINRDFRVGAFYFDAPCKQCCPRGKSLSSRTNLQVLIFVLGPEVLVLGVGPLSPWKLSQGLRILQTVRFVWSREVHKFYFTAAMHEDTVKSALLTDVRYYLLI